MLTIKTFFFKNQMLSYILAAHGSNSYELEPGKYFLEVFGADGAGDGGKGGYSRGYIRIIDKTEVFINVGGPGEISQNGIANGGANGGGNGFSNKTDCPAYGGGGSSFM